MTNFKKLFYGIVIKIKQNNWNKWSWENLDKTKILVPFRLFAHPVDTFNDIKYEKRGSVAIANFMLLVYFLEEIAHYFLVGYLFSNNEPQSFSIFPVILKSVLIVVIWCITNWAMCTLLEGDGTFKDIWLATCYSLLPLLLFRIPLDLLSRAMTLNESMFFSAFGTIFYGWTLLLVFVGMMVVHQFSVTKTIGSVLLTLGMIVIIAFLALLAFSISQQMVAFISTIITELFRR